MKQEGNFDSAGYEEKSKTFGTICFMSNRDFDTKDVYGGYRHGSAEVAITRELSHRLNGHYSLNYVYTSLKKKILNELGVDKLSIEDVVES